MTDETLGGRLRRYRVARDLTQRGIAEKLFEAETADREQTPSLTEAARRIATLTVSVSQYEAGRRPSARVLRMLADIFEVDVAELAGLQVARKAAKGDAEAEPPGESETRTGPPTLQELRTRRGLTQAEVAQALGITRAAYAFVEQGRSGLADSHAPMLAQLLRVTPQRLALALPTPSEPSPPADRADA
ncbi:DNA-binding XRE family transcriptional regulator [Krasilnikovia cinnamomea]|uniref:DNA-binding XRE family transcriptional regulator n=1 Tax=Krasilnikovia cinnamomea TaxID=349313 RepID=A0A4Q7Z7T8_9ACTN|nr:helix-turn-helix transcriptional regulator [Krasilnikovia cinnamomea]RZU46557.1 DNA-binding XRE family transcriptional regulator [Krasilnikovia cinnamomea]